MLNYIPTVLLRQIKPILQIQLELPLLRLYHVSFFLSFFVSISLNYYKYNENIINNNIYINSINSSLGRWTGEDVIFLQDVLEVLFHLNNLFTTLVYCCYYYSIKYLLATLLTKFYILSLPTQFK
jgi:hypothetical protein